MTLLHWREHPAARAELREAALWYDREKAGLGDRLVDEIAAVVSFVREWPDAAPAYHGRRLPSVRRKGAKTFPYGVVYFVRDDEVVVVAYAHDKRRPGYWRSRVKDL